MSQLTGEEQGKLVVLLTGNELLDPDRLDSALVHGGFKQLYFYATKGTFPAMVDELVKHFSAQYQCLELVEAILRHPQGLNGTCPPIEDWLRENRDELMRRKAAQR